MWFYPRNVIIVLSIVFIALDMESPITSEDMMMKRKLKYTVC